MATVCPTRKSVSVVTYNMHGLNQGAAMLLKLCHSYDIVFVKNTGSHLISCISLVT